MRDTIVKNKWKWLSWAVVSVITLLPMLAGILLWDRLPEQVATHWGANGEPDGWSSRSFAVFGLPLFLLALHAVCVLVSERGGGMVGQNPKLLRIVRGLCPAISLIIGFVVYAHALGFTFNMTTPALLLTGVLMMVIGNYLPKCTRNFYLGIRIPWTLADEDNWRMTHRFAGRLWMAGGALMLACLLLPPAALVPALLLIIAAMVLLPVVYSYQLSRRRGG